MAKRPRTPEQLENQAVALAYDVAIQQMKDGTASSQIITHFLKIGSEKDQLEKSKLIEEHKLLQAKTEAIASAADTKELYSQALDAMRRYSGTTGDVDEEL